MDHRKLNQRKIKTGIPQLILTKYLIKQEPSSKIVRQRMKLLEYDYEVLYQKGSQNSQSSRRIEQGGNRRENKQQ